MRILARTEIQRTNFKPKQSGDFRGDKINGIHPGICVEYHGERGENRIGEERIGVKGRKWSG